jgi:hypothetical protein
MANAVRSHLQAFLAHSESLTNYHLDFLVKIAGLNGRVFDTDPVVAYMLLDMSLEERLAYLPTYWSTLVRSALMNGAVITEADGWKAASVIIPPGKGIDNVWTLLYAGFLCVLWRIGISGLKVSTGSLCVIDLQGKTKNS